MSPQEVVELIKQIRDFQVNEKDGTVTCPVWGGELVFYGFHSHGAGEFYFNDTAD